MAWKAIDRKKPLYDPDAGPILNDAVREKIRTYFDRYETKRAVLLPALHVVQNSLGSIPLKAMVEIAELLEIHPSDVFDTITFYTHFWMEGRGKKVVTVCRSITCELMGSMSLLEELKKQLGIGEHETTRDGRYSLVTEECLAVCDYAPCMLINEKLHKRVRPQDVEGILADENNDRIDVPRSDLFDARPLTATGRKAVPREEKDEGVEREDDLLEATSDVKEMREAD